MEIRSGFALIIGLLFSHGVYAASFEISRDDTVSRMTAVAQKSSELVLPGDPASVGFVFGDTKAAVRADGYVSIEGWVTHRGLLCADYQLGVRLGQGNPGCDDVKWLTDAMYVTNNKQCNNARFRHNGADNNPAVKKAYPRVTCAERLIKCSGMCK